MLTRILTRSSRLSCDRHSSAALYPRRTFAVPLPYLHSEPGGFLLKSARAELRILGHTELAPAGRHTGGTLLRQPKRLALLAYLAMAASEGYRRRDQIVALFWPEQDQLHARTQLRKALYGFRALLGEDAFPARGDEELRVDTTKVWCDAVAFRRHCEAREWAAALDLYRGDLLEGLHPGGVGEAFESWLVEQRGVLRALASRAAWECSAAADVVGRRDEAIVNARRAVELSPDDEEGIRRLIAALDRYGDRAGALRIFAEWQERIQKEFGAEPAPETRKLARRVQAQRKGESLETYGQVRLASPERVPTPPAEQAAPAAKPPHRPAARRRFARIAATIGVVLIAQAVMMTSMAWRPSAQASVAVLPLRGFGDSLASVVGHAIADELTTQLAQHPEVSVRSLPRLSFSSADSLDIEELGRQLEVRNLLLGSVQRRDRRLRVNLRLVQAEDGLTRWARTFDLDAEDLLTSQARVASMCVEAISPALASASR